MTLTITIYETHGGQFYASASGLPTLSQCDSVTDSPDGTRAKADKWIREYLDKRRHDQ